MKKIPQMTLLIITLLILVSTTNYIKIRNEVIIAQKSAGYHFSHDVNNMYIFVKGLIIYVGEIVPEKPLSEKVPITKEGLLFYAGKANAYRDVSYFTNSTTNMAEYFGLLETELNTLAGVMNDPTQVQKADDTKKKILRISNALDQSLDLIQRSAEEKVGSDYLQWYRVNNDEHYPVHKQVIDILKNIPEKGEINTDNSYNTSGIHVSSSWIELSMPELFGYSEIVVSGKVVSISGPKEGKLNSLKDAARNDAIYTDYSFVVEETFKGSAEPGNLITIRVLGGETDKFKLIIDAVRPEPVKQQILFLKEFNDIVDSVEKTYIILTPSGKYTIEKEKNQAINEFQESHDISTLNYTLKKLRNEIGDKIILPPGILR